VGRLTTGISQALGRLKDLDVEGRDAVRAELQQCAETLDSAARSGMAALLQVRARVRARLLLLALVFLCVCVEKAKKRSKKAVFCG